jgi:anaerobic glycerol-3-phosphate dehydrogenase
MALSVAEPVAGSTPTVARRRDDAATIIRQLPASEALADVLLEQAKACGMLQHPAVCGDDTALASGFRRLATLHETMMEALATLIGKGER